MIFVYENVVIGSARKPIECVKCGYKRIFDVPDGVCVRKAKHSTPVSNVILLKCKKCGSQIGISMEGC